MKKLLLFAVLMASSSAIGQEKRFRIVYSEKELPGTELFYEMENDTTHVLLLVDEGVVEGEKISKRVRGVSGENKDRIFLKPLHYVINGREVAPFDVHYESHNSSRFTIYDPNKELWEYYNGQRYKIEIR